MYSGFFVALALVCVWHKVVCFGLYDSDILRHQWRQIVTETLKHNKENSQTVMYYRRHLIHNQTPSTFLCHQSPDSRQDSPAPARGELGNNDLGAGSVSMSASMEINANSGKPAKWSKQKNRLVMEPSEKRVNLNTIPWRVQNSPIQDFW